RRVNTPSSGVPSRASLITFLVHCTNLVCDFAGVEASKSAQGHWRAIAPRTPAMALASLKADAPAPHLSVAATAVPPSSATIVSTPAAVIRRADTGELSIVQILLRVGERRVDKRVVTVAGANRSSTSRQVVTFAPRPSNTLSWSD